MSKKPNAHVFEVRQRLAFNFALIHMQAFGMCGNCVDESKACIQCQSPFAYYNDALKQPFGSVMMRAPPVYLYLFERNKSVFYDVPYFMVFMGYRSAIDVLRVMLNPEYNNCKYTDMVEMRQRAMLRKWNEAFEVFKTNIDVAYEIQDTKKGRLEIVRTMEQLIVVGFACIEHVNELPNTSNMYEITLRQWNMKIATDLHETEETVPSNTRFNKVWHHLSEESHAKILMDELPQL